jgi:hypothetical protein
MGGVFSKPSSPAPVQAVVKQAEEMKPQAQATQMQEQEGARMRGARRRGRQLLSDARLMGETGVETLGGGQQL